MPSHQRPLMESFSGPSPVLMDVSHANINAFVGRFATMVRTNSGTSFIQAALNQFPEETMSLCRAELLPHVRELVLDGNASYAVRRMMEADCTILRGFVEHITTLRDEAYCLQLCTASLHTRRFVAFILNHAKPEHLQFFFDVATRHVEELACAKHGCLALQKLILAMPPLDQQRTLERCFTALARLATDQHGQYMISFLTDQCGPLSAANTTRIATLLRDPTTLGDICSTAHGSSCIERLIRTKSDVFGPPIVAALNALSETGLQRVANDAYGNYVIQAVLGTLPLPAVQPLVVRLGAMSHALTYGNKIFRSLTGARGAGQDSIRPTGVPLFAAAEEVPGGGVVWMPEGSANFCPSKWMPQPTVMCPVMYAPAFVPVSCAPGLMASPGYWAPPPMLSPDAHLVTGGHRKTLTHVP